MDKSSALEYINQMFPTGYSNRGRYNRKKGFGYFRERITMPFGGSLDVVFVDTGSLQQEVLGGALKSSRISQLKELTRILKAADGDWRIVVGSDPLLAYTLTKEAEEAKGIASTFDQIMTKYGVVRH
ncbi:unnamed protein product [Arabidopsis lyrata]|nr:unnamed protein product [Arabidopsis lyrata]